MSENCKMIVAGGYHKDQVTGRTARYDGFLYLYLYTNKYPYENGSFIINIIAATYIFAANLDSEIEQVCNHSTSNFQAITLGWRAKFSLFVRWAITSSKSISPPV